MDQQIHEIKLRTTTKEFDLDTKIRTARDFLTGGDKVKFVLQLQKGEDPRFSRDGRVLLQRLVEGLSDLGSQETGVLIEKKTLVVVVAPPVPVTPPKPVFRNMYDEPHPEEAPLDPPHTALLVQVCSNAPKF